MTAPESRVQPTIERLEAAREELATGDHDDPFPGFYAAVIELLELAQRRFPRDPDDPLIDYALDLANAVTATDPERPGRAA